MIDFQYHGQSADGVPCKGLVLATDLGAARMKLLSQGISIIDISEADGAVDFIDGGIPSGFKLTNDEILLFTRELSHLKQANMPLDKAMSILKETAQSDGLKLFIRRVDDGIRGGKSLFQSLAPFERALGKKYLVMVRAGEAAGSLNVVMKEMAVQLEADFRLRNHLVSALTYPAILFVVSVLSVVLLLTFVVPQFRGIFDSMGESLPLTTRFVIAFSDFVRGYWIEIAFSIMIIAFGFSRWRSSDAGKVGFDGMLLNAPMLGVVIKNLQLAIYFRTLGMLLQRGVSLTDSLVISVDAVTNSVLRREAEPMVNIVKSGKRLSEAFRGNQFGVAGVFQLIRVAEETGELEATLLGLGERFEDQSTRTMTRVLSVIEPVIIICLGAVVAFIIIAILGGVLSINETI